MSSRCWGRRPEGPPAPPGGKELIRLRIDSRSSVVHVALRSGVAGSGARSGGHVGCSRRSASITVGSVESCRPVEVRSLTARLAAPSVSIARIDAIVRGSSGRTGSRSCVRVCRLRRVSGPAAPIPIRSQIVRTGSRRSDTHPSLQVSRADFELSPCFVPCSATRGNNNRRNSAPHVFLNNAAMFTITSLPKAGSSGG